MSMCKKAMILGGAVGVLVLVLFLFAWHDYPLFRTDSSFFIPTAINLAAGKGLTNHFDPLIRVFDQTGQHRYMTYGPLFPAVLSMLMPSPTPHSAFLAIALLNSLRLTLDAWVFYRLATFRRNALTWFGTLLIALALIGEATYMVGKSTGRPEILTALLLTLSVLLVLLCRHRAFLTVGLGVLLGAMGCTQYIGGVLLLLMITAYYAATQPLKAALRSVALVSIIAAGSFWGLFRLLNPYPLADIWAALQQHMHIAVSRNTDVNFWSEFFEAHFLSQHTTFYGVLVACAVVAYGHLTWRFRHLIRAPWLFWPTTLLVGFVFYRTSINPSYSSYNLYQCVSVFFGILIVYAVHLLGKGRSRPLLLKSLATVVMLLTTVGFMKSLVLFPAFLQEGLSLPQARRLFQEIQREAAVPMGVTPALWVLSENHTAMFMFRSFEDDMYATQAQKQDTILVLQQKYVAGFPPRAPLAETPHHRLYRNYFCPTAPRLFGIPLSKTVPGYQFAVYVPKHSAWRKPEP